MCRRRSTAYDRGVVVINPKHELLNILRAEVHSTGRYKREVLRAEREKLQDAINTGSTRAFELAESARKVRLSWEHVS